MGYKKVEARRVTSLEELMRKAEEELLECDYVLGKKERPEEWRKQESPPNVRATSVFELLDRHERNKKKYLFEKELGRVRQGPT